MENVRIAIRDSTDSHNVAFFDNISGIRYQSANLQRFLAGSASVLTIEYNSKDIDMIRTGCKLAFIYKERAYWLNIMDLSKKGYKVEITAYSIGLELNQEERGAHKPANAMSFAEYLAYYDPEHALELGVNEVADKRIKLEWTGTDTILARLFSIANSFDAELEFTVELNQDYSLKRQVLNVYKKGNLGSNRAANPVRVGRGLKVINYSDNLKELRTAVRATGKDGLTLDGLNKKVYDDDGNLLYYSNANIVYAPQSRDKYPSVGKKSNDNWIIKELGETEYSTKDDLWGYMLGELKKICVPEITYDIEGAVDGDVGDTRTLIDDVHYDPPLYVQARISELTEDLITGGVTKSTLTNFERKYSQVASELLKQVEQLANDAAPYIIRLETNNGFNFKNSKGSSIVTANLEKNGKIVGASWQWIINNSLFSDKQSVTINASQVTGTLNVVAVASVDGNEVAREYITFTNSDDGVGIKSIKRYYTTNDQAEGVTAGGQNWSTKPTTVTAEKNYMWSYDVITYTNDTSLVTEPAVIGARGDDGLDADTTGITEALDKAKQELTALSANIEKVRDDSLAAVEEAKQQLATVANDLSKAKTDLQNAVSAVDTKATNLQSDLTKAKQDLQTSINSVDSKADGIQSNLTKAKTELNTAIAAVNTKATNLQTDVSNLNTSLSNTSKTVQSHVTALANQAKELQDQADQLTAQAEAQDALATRVETVETTANGTKSTVSELSKTVASNTNNITSVTNRTKTVETDLTSAKTSISELQTNLSSTQTGLTNLTKRTKDVEDDLSGTKTTLTELSQTVADDGETITGLTTKTATIESSVNGLKTSLTNTQKDLTSVTTRTKNIEDDLAGTKTSLTSLSQTVAADGQTITSLSNKTKTIESNVDGLTTSLSNTQKDLTSVTNRTKTVEDTLDGTRTELAELQETVDTTNSNLASVTERTSTVESDLSGTKTSLSNLTKTVSDDGKTIANLSSQTKTIESTVNGLSTSLTSTQQDLAGITTRTKNVEDDLSGTKTELAELQTTVGTTNTDLANVTKRTKTVEDDLAGTKTSLSSLSQTVDNDGKNITSLTSRTKTVEDSVSGLTTTMTSVQQTLTSTTSRTKTVEDDLAGTKTTLSQVKTTADNTSKKTATLETGLSGLTAKFDNFKIGGTNLLLYSADPWQAPQTGYYQFFGAAKTSETYNGAVVYKTSGAWNRLGINLDNHLVSRGLLKVGDVLTYSVLAKTDQETPIQSRLFVRYNNQSGTENISGKAETINLTNEWQKVSVTFTVTEKMLSEDHRVNYLGWEQTTNSESGKFVYYTCNKIERGNVATDYSPNEADLEQKVAEYKQNADQNYASLQTTVQNLDGTVQQNKTIADQTAQGFSTRIESLETYKDGENTRANQYFESAKTETARQLTAERTAIAKDYVAKSTYTSDVTGIRNDLTATTTTANTTKTNLANYQASNDKAVANLQSNLQTANGNISSLKTKVEAVPGQITSAVSAVEGKIPKSVGGRNLIIRSQIQNGYIDANGNLGIATKQFTTGFIDGTNNKQFTITAPKFELGNLEWLRVAKYDANKNFMGRDLISYTKDTKTVKTITLTNDVSYFKVSFDGVYGDPFKIERGSLATDWSPAPEDAIEEISSLSSQIQQTADGMTLLATKTELNTAKSDLQSGITTATNKANAAQSTADNNAQTISTHTTQISALNTGLSAKVSQTDFNTLSGRVTTAENNIIAKANELSSQISSVSKRIPSEIGAVNLIKQSTAQTGLRLGMDAGIFLDSKHALTDWIKIEPSTVYTLTTYEDVTETNMWYSLAWYSSNVNDYSGRISRPTGAATAANLKGGKQYTSPANATYAKVSYPINYPKVKLERGNIATDYSPSPEDYDSALSTAKSEIKQTTDSITASVSSIETKANTAQSTANTAVSKADAAQAGVNTLDSTTVKTATLNLDNNGFVTKVGKTVNGNTFATMIAQNESDVQIIAKKMKVSADMIVNGAITADKIAANAITADMITGGKLKSTNGATIFDLNGGTLTFNNNYGYIQRVANDKIFEITTYLGNDISSQEYLSSTFGVRKSDNSRNAGIKFALYTPVENKPTAEAKINADAFVLYDSKNTMLFSVHGRNTFGGTLNTQDWGDIPIAEVHGGLIVNDIGIGGHIKPLLKIVEELCKKAGILWV